LFSFVFEDFIIYFAVWEEFNVVVNRLVLDASGTTYAMLYILHYELVKTV